MAPPPEKQRSKKSLKKKTGSGRNKPNNNSGRDRPAVGGFQRVDAMERMPSNAPTMAIAPSDYEHIFHEAAGAPAATNVPTQSTSPSPPPPPGPSALPKPRTPEPSPFTAPPQTVVGESMRVQPTAGYGGHIQYGTEIQVTPDGYTLLGQTPNGSRVPLPPYVVRANNQFSRPVLAKVGRYLLSRSEMPR